MSLAINVDVVEAVLLADGWHLCDPLVDGSGDSSFDLDTFEFMEGDLLIFRGGETALIPTIGFFFREDGAGVAGPLTSVLAVRTRR